MFLRYELKGEGRAGALERACTAGRRGQEEGHDGWPEPDLRDPGLTLPLNLTERPLSRTELSADSWPSALLCSGWGFM